MGRAPRSGVQRIAPGKRAARSPGWRGAKASGALKGRQNRDFRADSVAPARASTLIFSPTGGCPPGYDLKALRALAIDFFTASHQADV